MIIDINLTNEQVKLLAKKLGWEEQIEDTSQELEGDSYPLIDNPITAEQFAAEAANFLISEKLNIALRSELINTVKNLHNQVIEQINSGTFDPLIMTMDTQEVLNIIISGLNEQ